MRELTGHPGVDIVVDPAGADRVHGSLRSLAREGRLLIIGSTGGNVAQINVDDLMRNNLNVSGVGWGAFWARQPSNLQEQWAALLPLLQAGELQPVLGRRFPLEQASQALLELDQRRAQGKVLLDVRRDGPAGSQPGASEEDESVAVVTGPEWTPVSRPGSRPRVCGRPVGPVQR